GEAAREHRRADRARWIRLAHDVRRPRRHVLRQRPPRARARRARARRVTRPIVPPESPALSTLLACLELEPLDRDLYLGDPGPGEGRLFGGMVAAQSAVAAYRTVDDADDRPLHSLHAYFLRPGRHDLPIRFVVDRIRDGKTFTTRNVVAHQGGEAIFDLAASFAQPETGLSYQDTMPEAPPPDTIEDWETQRARALGRRDAIHSSAVELR